MKNLITLIMVVVAFLVGGFQKVSGQSDSCIHLRFKFYFSDSSFWNRNINDLKEIVSYAEQKINSIPGLSKKFRCSYVDTVKLTKADQVGAYYWDTKKAQGGQWSAMTVHIDKKEKDTLVMPVYLGNMRMFLFRYPSAEYGQNICNPTIAGYPLVGARNILLASPDSIGYTDPWMKLIFVRAILQTITGYRTQAQGIMHEDAWKITDSWDQATATAVNNQSCYCIPKVYCKMTDTDDQENNSNPHKIVIWEKKIMNPEGVLISIYDIIGRRVLSTNGNIIDLSSLQYKGILLIKAPKGKPIKFFLN